MLLFSFFLRILWFSIGVGYLFVGFGVIYCDLSVDFSGGIAYLLFIDLDLICVLFGLWISCWLFVVVCDWIIIATWFSLLWLCFLWLWHLVIDLIVLNWCVVMLGLVRSFVFEGTWLLWWGFMICGFLTYLFCLGLIALFVTLICFVCFITLDRWVFGCIGCGWFSRIWLFVWLFDCLFCFDYLLGCFMIGYVVCLC